MVLLNIVGFTYYQRLKYLIFGVSEVSVVLEYTGITHHNNRFHCPAYSLMNVTTDRARWCCSWKIIYTGIVVPTGFETLGISNNVSKIISWASLLRVMQYLFLFERNFLGAVIHKSETKFLKVPQWLFPNASFNRATVNLKFLSWLFERR